MRTKNCIRDDEMPSTMRFGRGTSSFSVFCLSHSSEREEIRTLMFYLLHQTILHVDTDGCIFEKQSRLGIASPASSELLRKHCRCIVSVPGHARYRQNTIERTASTRLCRRLLTGILDERQRYNEFETKKISRFQPQWFPTVLRLKIHHHGRARRP